MGPRDRTAPRASLMTPAEAAAVLDVTPRTVARWAAEGRLLAVRTPGGHRRYRATDIRDLAGSRAATSPTS